MNNYSEIDLDKVKEKVIEYCAIEEAKQYIINEAVSFNPLVIKNNLKQTNEAYRLLKDGFIISFDGVVNICDILIKTKKDIALNGIECANILNFHNHCLRIKNQLSKIEEEISIKDYSDSISISMDLAKSIEKVVDNNGNIKENASEHLADIFYKINKNINDIHSASNSFLNKHANSLQENSVFYRNDRVAFLLKNSDKNKFNGYQYGSSASGLATYVEPEQFVELNNKRLALENEKIEEVNRILKNLSYKIASYADMYLLNFDSLLKLDVIFSKAEYGYYTNGVVARISNDQLLYIKDIAHPLIDEDKVVVNTYSLNKPNRGIVISGTNTGGKTVGLKVIGLSVLMSYLGLPLIASEASIPLFSNLFIDIDDNQSISNSLSTFSAHIRNINNILNNADNNSLILIDELISGTDPKEAQAISLAILEKILELNSYFVITTHYDDIKQFAYNNPNILLSSVGFDLKELKPTYKYIENSIGVSNAIDIASRYFTDQSIIDNARRFINLNKTKEEELIEKLSKEISENEYLRDSLNKKIIENEKIKEDFNKKLSDFESEKDELRAKYNKELNEYIDSVKERIENEFSKINYTVDSKENIIKKIEKYEINKPKKEPIIFEVGDNVKVGESSRNGEIIDISGENVSVNINGLIVKTKLNNLTKLAKINKNDKYKPRQKMSRVSRELNLVGERVEDGLSILDNYLDNAYGSGLSEVKIIHGFGTGQLRNAIREHLKKLKFVSEFSNGDAYDGGSNVTIVKFRK